MADERDRSSGEGHVSVPKRVWSWFNAQGLGAKFVVGVVTAVVTALAVGGASRAVFGSGGDTATPPTTTTLAPDAAPFSIAARTHYGEAWAVWLADPLPDPARWPPPAATEDDLHRFTAGLGAIDDGTFVHVVLDGTASRTTTITTARAVVVRAARRRRTHTSRRCSKARRARSAGTSISTSHRRRLTSSPISHIRPRAIVCIFANRTVTVAPGEAVSIDAYAKTDTCDCTWVTELDVVVNGKPRPVGRQQRHALPHVGRRREPPAVCVVGRRRSPRRVPTGRRGATRAPALTTCGTA